MTVLSLTQTRENLSDILNRVHYTGERIIIKKHGKNVAAFISMKEMALLERVIQYLEDETDIRDADAALAESKKEGFIPLDKIKADLGL